MKFVLFFIAGALCSTGCGLHHLIGGSEIVGSGNRKTETRSVGSFHRIEVGGATLATVKVGPTASVKITADDNILPLIKTSSDGATLLISQTGSMSSERRVEAVITVPSLDGLKISGACVTTVSGMASPSLEIEASGASKVTAEGRADSVKVVASGASHVFASSLRSKSAEVEASGASDVHVLAEQSIKGNASGASHVFNAGGGKSEVSASGVSSVSSGS